MECGGFGPRGWTEKNVTIVKRAGGLALDSARDPRFSISRLGPVRAGLSGTRDRLVAVEVKCVSCWVWTRAGIDG